MKFSISAWLITVTACLVTMTAAPAQDIELALYSEVLQEQRTLNVRLPDDYAQAPDQRYEVVIVTDGEWHMETLSYLHGFARGNGLVPPAIIVALPNSYLDGVNQRDRDFLPGAGAEAFVAFIRDEVIPRIDEQYRTNGERTLVGHSHGGLFATYTLLMHPELFNAYIATDPSLWWDDRMLVQLAGERLPLLEGLGRTYWLAGIDSTAEQTGVAAMASALQQHAPAGFAWSHAVYPDEVHNSVALKGMYDGLKFTFAGMTGQDVAFHPMAGRVVAGQPFTVRHFTTYGDVRFTLDGRTPTRSSPRLAPETELVGPVTLSAGTMSNRGQHGVVTRGEFRAGPPLPAVDLPGAYTAGGLDYSSYPGQWEAMPDFNAQAPGRTGRAVSGLEDTEWPTEGDAGLVLDGFFHADEAGHYLFILYADDGARLWINDQVILEAGMNGQGAGEQSYIVALAPGFHPVRLEYFERSDDARFVLRYVPPGQAIPVPVPVESLYGRQ